MDVRGTYFGRTGYIPRGWGLSPGGDCRVAVIRHCYHQLILVEILARDGVGCIFSSFLRPNSKRIHFCSKEAKEILSTTLV